MNQAELDQLSSDLRLACMRVARRARTESRNQIPQHQYAVLTTLENGALALGVLAEREAVSAPVMSRNVNELERLGYVRRESLPGDRRQTMVQMTESGDRLRQEVKRNRDEWMAARLATLSDGQLEQLRSATAVLQLLATAA